MSDGNATGSPAEGSKPASGILNLIVERLSPRVLGVALVVGIVALAAVLAVGVMSGSEVSFWGMKISPGATPTPAGRTPDAAPPIHTPPPEAAIVRGDIPGLWKPGMTKQDLIAALLADDSFSPSCNDDNGELDCLYATLENRMGRSGGFIDLTRAPKDTVIRVQKALGSVDAYDGEEDGNPTMTRTALLAFQHRYNIRNDQNAFEGKMGLKTLRKIRERHKNLVVANR